MGLGYWQSDPQPRALGIATTEVVPRPREREKKADFLALNISLVIKYDIIRAADGVFLWTPCRMSYIVTSSRVTAVQTRRPQQTALSGLFSASFLFLSRNLLTVF
mmetsp:Transcript_7125/g.14233  ORF Transcript_7125/g.14233 Transcript_7125/m.14233 type:complete len:105 (+) Transcript_7125:124-438(+)